MEFQEAKQQYIEAWGALGSSWGINKAMAQIHALLLISPEALSAEEVMNELRMSRGNVNMNLRSLINWGIAEKIHKVGERKEFFIANKDVWELARQVAKERRKREIDPMLKVFERIRDVSGDSKEINEFKKVTGELNDFSIKVDNVIDKFTRSDQNWFVKFLLKL